VDYLVAVSNVMSKSPNRVVWPILLSSVVVLLFLTSVLLVPGVGSTSRPTSGAPLPFPTGAGPSVLPKSAAAGPIAPGALAGPSTSPRLIATIPVGVHPIGVAYDSGKGEVFVANSVSYNVSVINDASHKVVATVAVGPDPLGAAYDSRKGEVFVTNSGNSSVSVISDATNTVVAWVGVGSSPWAVAYDPAKSEVFVASLSSNNVSVINDTLNRVVATMAVGSGPAGVAYDSAKGEGFVTNSGSSNVSVISDATNTVVATVAVGIAPTSVAFDPAKSEAFVANDGSDNMSVISDATNTVVATRTAGNSPYGQSLAYDSGKGEVFFANFSSDNVSVINDTLNTVVATVAVGSGPVGVAYDSANGEVFVANSGSSNVSVISDVPLVATLSPGTATIHAGESTTLTLGFSGGVTPVTWTLEMNGSPANISTVGGNSFDFAPDHAGTYTCYLNATDALGSWSNATATVTVLPRPTFTVTFGESGIPAKSLAKHGWTVELNGTVKHSNSATIGFSGMLNGSYSRLVTGPSGYISSATRSVLVSGPTSVPVAFSKGRTVTLTFGEKGLPKTSGVTQRWCVVVDGDQQCSMKSSQKYTNLTPGTYAYAVVSPLTGQNITAKTGPQAVPTSGQIPIPASGKISLSFVYKYAITFTESGTYSGTWSVTLKGLPKSNATGDPIVFYLPNGTYHFAIAPIPGHRVTPASGHVIVSGSLKDILVQILDAVGGASPVTTTVVANPALVATLSSSPATTQVGESSTLSYSFTGGVLPITWTLANNGSAANLTGASGGHYTFTPVQEGTYVFYLNATDHIGSGSQATSIVIVLPALVAFLSPHPGTIQVGENSTLSLGFVGGVNPVTWTLEKNGSLVNLTGASGGFYTFFPAHAGKYTFYLNATDAVGSTSDGTATVTVDPGAGYSVTFTERGLPTGTGWFVNLTGGPSHGSETDMLIFPEPNGSYDYSIGTANTSYEATGGSFTVTGAPVSKSVTFGLIKYTVTFTENGILAKTLAKDGWTVELNGTQKHSFTTTIGFLGMPNGSYFLLVTGPLAYVSSATKSVLVSGPTSVPVAFSKGKTVTLTFSEKGLPKTSGVTQPWCVAVDGDRQCTAKTSQKYTNLTPGTYSYAVVSPLAGQNITQKVGLSTTYGPSGSITLATSAKVALTFAYRYAVTFTESGPYSGTWSITIKAVTLSNTSAGPIVFHLQNGTYGFSVHAVTGYSRAPVAGHFTVAGAPVSKSITFTLKRSHEPAGAVATSALVREMARAIEIVRVA